MTLTIGGNDLGFSKVLKFCARHWSCMNYNGMVERTARAAGLEFIATAETFIRHEPCGGLVPRWMDFITVGGGESRFLDPGTLHPNRNGHYVLSRLISCYLSVPASVTVEPKRLSDCARYGDVPVRPARPVSLALGSSLQWNPQ